MKSTTFTKISVAALLLSALPMFASDAKTVTTDKHQIIKDMKVLEDGVAMIQKGFLYGSKDMVKDGVKVLKDGNKIVAEKEKLPSYLPEAKKALYKNAYKEGLKVNAYSEQMLKNLEEKKFSQAYESYAKILNSCNTCHLIIRDWK